MQNIYLGARTVNIWLGTRSNEIYAALQTIRKFIAIYSSPLENPGDVLNSDL